MDLLSNLSPAQQTAVKQTDGHVLILAGAGSGKTRVLTYKAAYLLSKGIRPDSILLVTFTNKASNEMKERVMKLIVPDKQYTINNAPFVGTFHSFCARLLRIDGKHIGLSSDYVIYDTDDSTSLIKKIMADLDISTKQFKPHSILNGISSAKSELLSASDYEQFARGYFSQTVAKVYREYQKSLAEIGACDFDDLLFKTVKLLQADEGILSKWAGRFKYVMIDEYQDVNTAQYALSKLLASVHGNLTVVGDAAQAIYSFRGADFRNILNFQRDFADCRVFNLEQNYRSTQNILSAANAIISQNSSHPILKLWTENSTGEKISIYNAENEVDEANFIVGMVTGSKKPLSSFAVLYRTNAQSRTVEEAFLHSNIPYRLYGGVRFYERKEIKDVLSYLRFLLNPKDNVARTRIEKLGKRRMEKFEEMKGQILDPVRVGKTRQVENDDGKVSLIAPITLIDKVLEATDYLILIDDGTDVGLSRVENVKELRSVARDFEDLPSLLENIALMEGKNMPDKSYESDVDVVTLMTIHTAKGLEFDDVFIVGMEEGLFPHARSMLDMGQLEEERRLAYVGMTRARHKLYLSYATQRLYFGTTSTNMVSRFLVDIPQELVTAV